MAASDLKFGGRVAVVTGAGGGLGRTYALLLAAAGCKVVVNDLGSTMAGGGKDTSAADKVVAEIRAAGGEAVANYDSVENGAAIIKTAVDAFGTIDILINNAGILRDKSFLKMTDADWDIIQAVHLRGAFACTHAAWPIMREKGYGRIIMTSSAAGIYGNFGQANYSSAKLALVGLGYTLAREGEAKNVLVNTIAPVAGSRLTATVLPPHLLESLKPEYIAPVVAYLVHDSCTVNGGLFELGGGWISRLRWERNQGVLIPSSSLTIESVRNNIAAIGDFSGPVEYPNGGIGPRGMKDLNPEAAMPDLRHGELRFDGRVVIVTGAGGGLGRSFAHLFAARGARVVVNDLGGSVSGAGANASAADVVVNEIKSMGGIAVANYDSVENGAAIVKTALDHFGRVDIVINNAGILRDKSFQKMTPQDWDLVQKVHVKGTYSVSKAAWPHMMEQKYGRIICVSSSSGIYGNFGQANYSAAKMAILGLGCTLAREGEKKNVLVNTIAPVAGSRMTASVMPEAVLNALKPEFVAPLVGYLCHESSTENGGIFEVGAGLHAKVRWQRTKGVYLGPGVYTSAQVANAMPRISDFSHAAHPTAPSDAFSAVMEFVGGTPSDVGPQDKKKKAAAAPSAGAGAGAAAGGKGKKGNSDVDVAAAMAHRFTGKPLVVTPRDLILYALGVGASRDPSDARELQYVYENSQDFQALPTFGVVSAGPLLMQVAQTPGLKFNPMMLLHGEQYMEVRTNEIPTNDTFTSTGRLSAIYDKGDKGTVVVLDTTTKDSAGKEVFFNQFTLFIRGIGNFGGDRGPATPPDANEPPARAPDAVEREATLPNQAVLYRLSGDYNPLHIDPSMAAMGGFSKPILHGLCTLGFASRAVLKHFGNYDGKTFKNIRVRFAKSVYPGETVMTEMWKVSPTKIVFQVKVLERDEIVIKAAAIELQGGAAGAPAAGGAASPADSSKAGAVFASLRESLAANPSILKEIGKVYHFIVEGVHWMADLKNGSGSITQGQGKADCTITIGEDDFVALMAGRLNSTQAFMDGRLKVSGDISAASKLSKLSPKSKL